MEFGLIPVFFFALYVHLSSNGKYLMCEIFTWNKFQCKSSALSSLIKIKYLMC